LGAAKSSKKIPKVAGLISFIPITLLTSYEICRFYWDIIFIVSNKFVNQILDFLEGNSFPKQNSFYDYTVF